MYRYFKNLIEKTSCSMSGACTIHPSISAMYKVLLNEIREISFYLVKMKEFGFTNKPIMAQSIEALSTFMINTSINKTKYLKLINQLECSKKEIIEKYSKYCKNNELPCEIIKSRFEITQNSTVSDLINLAQTSKTNQNVDITKQALFELIILFAKLCAINSIKIKAYDNSNDEFDYEILRFFALTNSYSIRNDKIIRRIKEFSKIAFKMREKLSFLEENLFGKKQSATISTTIFKGKGILVSGSDLDELDNVLKTIEKINPKEEISVYTNGLLFLAHFYPYFQKNKYLKGHFGTDDAQYDFSTFKGAILITKNFLQKIDSLYKGEIFSNKLISYTKVIDIENNDYKPLIETSLNLKGINLTKENQSYCVNYDIEKLNIIKAFKEEEIVLIAGDIDNKDILKDYKNKKIITFDCPQESDLLLKSVQILNEKKVKMTVFFPYCALESLNVLSSIIQYDINFYIANCSHILINPHVLEALKENFNAKII